MKISLAVALSFALPGLAFAEGAGGIHFTAPTGWTAQPERPMRVATYKIPHAKADTEDGELAVFYFGEGQGGTIDANVERWAGQFEGGPNPTTKKQTQGGVEVTRVELSGTYTASMGPNGPMGPGAQKSSHPSYKLLGAIVDIGKGPVFWKLIGPSATVEAARASFDKLVRGIKKE
jgi:hypothetical protein